MGMAKIGMAAVGAVAVGIARWSFFALAALSLPLFAAETPGDFFESKVRPVLARCYGCHAENAVAGLRVDSREGLLRGGKSGPAIVVGAPDESAVVQAVKGIGGRMAMPPAGNRLEAHEIEALSRWIAMGAPWPLSPREFFAGRIQPVLAQKCLGCHAETPQGGLRLDTREALLKGGKSGPAIVPGNAAESLLIRAVSYDHALKMPPTGALPVETVADFKQWIDDGAVWPGGAAAAVSEYVISDEHRAHWAFQPLADAPAPPAADEDDGANAVDRFLSAKLREKSLAPSPPAGKRALIRRLTYDLTGLPPSPREVEAFAADASPDAYEKLVERLLASPAYGERWGRHWLDIARYADTAGDAGDFPVPEAYKYRNYVIDSFNRDKPYDEFIREQIAGDLLPYETEEERWEQTIATGYIAISRRIGVSPHRLRHITIEDTIDNLGKTFLGLSIQCARCHDHKFDPIPTADYYALYGIFDSSIYPHAGAEHLPYRSDFVYRTGAEKAREALRDYEKKLIVWNDREREKFREYQSFQNMLITTPGRNRAVVWRELEAIRAERAVFARTEPPLETAYAVRDGGPKDAAIQVYGDPKSKGPLVRRGFLQILGGKKLPEGYAGSGRLLLADAVADPENPLTARVMVNRIWHHHFGAGLVKTTSDFGMRGSPSTHPALLDYLARYFIDGGWSVKRMHRLIVHSRAYRRASLDNAENHAIDPQNNLLWRANRRRLDAEQIRDSLLAFSGDLDRSMGGRHPFPHRRTYFYRQHEPFTEEYATNLRSVYMMQQRIQKNPYLDLFDGPDGNLPLSERKATTTTLQALFLMNSKFLHEQSQTIAERWTARAAGPRAFIDRAYRTIFGRAPTPAETLRGESFLAAAGPASRARPSYLRAMLSSNEFLFTD